jgi:hypothetical protein
MYIIDRIEHGNGGLSGSDVLDELPLREALKKKPSDYGVYVKDFGFWPVISRKKDGVNNYSYFWDDDDKKWVKKEKDTRKDIDKEQGFVYLTCLHDRHGDDEYLAFYNKDLAIQHCRERFNHHWPNYIGAPITNQYGDWCIFLSDDYYAFVQKVSIL